MTEERAPADALEASVVVPSYNARGTIVACLEALRAQETARRHEVLLVDSSDDGTERLVAERFPPERFPALRVIHLDGRTLPGAARNVGIRAARGSVLAFTDADCVPGPGWLEGLLARRAAEGCAGLGGSVVSGWRWSPVSQAGCLVEFNAFLPSMPAADVELLPSCNVAFERGVFERHGLFPEDLWPSEDHLFCHRLARAGERLVFEPAIAVRHLFRRELASFLRHQRRLGAASARARQLTDLPHAWLATHPARYGVPLMRLARIESRLLRRDPARWLLFNALAPWCLPGLVAWGVGFCRGGEAADGAGRAA